MNYVGWPKLKAGEVRGPFPLPVADPDGGTTMSPPFVTLADLLSKIDRLNSELETSRANEAACIAEVGNLGAKLGRCQSTNDFLAESLKAANESLTAFNRLGSSPIVLSGHGADCVVLSMTRDALDKAPPSVQDWLKAFGGYSGAQNAPAPVSEPPKPVDPRSEELSRALHSSGRVLDGYGR